jgi:hypothetical protein
MNGLLITAALPIAAAAYQGIQGVDQRPLLDHVVRMAQSTLLRTDAQRAVALLHDAGTPAYSNFSEEDLRKAMATAGLPHEIIEAVFRFNRPPDNVLGYEAWIWLLRSSWLLGPVKLADVVDTLHHFAAGAAPSQLKAWQRAKTILSSRSAAPASAHIQIAAARDQLSPSLSLLAAGRLEHVTAA